MIDTEPKAAVSKLAAATLDREAGFGSRVFQRESTQRADHVLYDYIDIYKE